MSLKQRAITGAKWTAVSTVVMIGLQFAQVTVLARLLASNEFGMLAMVAVVTGLTDMFLDMGITNAIIQRKVVNKADLSSLYWLNIMIGMALAMSIFLTSGAIADFFNEGKLKGILHWVALIFLITPHAQQYRALMQKELKFNFIAKAEVTAAAANFILATSFAYLGMGVMSAIYALLIAAVIRTGLFISSGLHLFKPTWHFSFKETKPYLNFGLYQTGDLLINYVNTNFGSAIIGRVVGAAALGGYNLAFNTAVSPPSRINPILTRVLFPVFSKIQDDLEKLRINFYKLLSFVGIINFPLLLGLFATAPNFVPLVFGEKWIDIVPIMQLLCIVGLLRSIGNPIGSLLMAKGRVALSFKFNCFKVFLLLPSMLAGAYINGVMGVAIGFLAVQVLNTFLSYFVLIKPVLGNSYKDYLRSIFLPLKMTLPMLVVVYALNYLDHVGIYLSHGAMVAIQIAVGGAIYIAGVFLSQDALVKEIKSIVFNKFEFGSKA